MGALHQRLSEQAGEEGAVELGQVGEVGVQGLVEGILDHRVAAAEVEDPVAGEEVEGAAAPVVDEVGTLTPHVGPVEAEGAEHPGQLGVEVAVVEVVGLALVGGQ